LRRVGVDMDQARASEKASLSTLTVPKLGSTWTWPSVGGGLRAGQRDGQSFTLAGLSR